MIAHASCSWSAAMASRAVLAGRSAVMALDPTDAQRMFLIVLR